MKEALLWEPRDENRVKCLLCAHGCLIKSGETGICAVRQNRDGKLYSLVYGRAISANLDPIEKKPLFHFLPGTKSLSIATVGCNFKCRHCQNSDISQLPRDGHRIEGGNLPPEDVVAAAISRGAASISYTYTEPTIFFEYALDTARLASQQGIKNVFVTNGYMSRQALEMIDGDLHAANVDLKAFTDDFYKSVCGAKLEPVKDTIKAMWERGVWVEVTTLLIPGYNDDADELAALADWLVSVSPEMPWHISAFRPTYHLTDAPSTPVSTIHKARDIGIKAGIRYVYAGNVWGDDGEKTSCHNCGRVVIDRVGFSIRSNRLRDGACPDCGEPVAGVWS